MANALLEMVGLPAQQPPSQLWRILDLHISSNNRKAEETLQESDRRYPWQQQ